MRKSDTLQLVIIILSIVMGFSALQSFITSVLSFLFILTNEGGGVRYTSTVAPYLLAGLLQAVTAWILLTKSKDLSLYFYERTGIGRSFRIMSNPADILFVLLIVLGIYMLISQLPLLLTAILDAFKSKAAAGYSTQDVHPGDILTGVIRMLLPLALLMFTKPIANYFSDKMTTEEMVFSEEGSDEADLLDLNEV